MKKIWIVFGVLAVVFLALSFKGGHQAAETIYDDKAFITFPNGQTTYADVADDPVEQTQGLSDRSTPESMLFLFDQKTRSGFWMKDMRFAIDIIWLYDEQVIGFEKNLQPEDPPKTIYRSPGLITAALEIPAGTVDKHRLEIGNRLDIRLPQQ